jgi:hypothetical protein
MKLEEAIAYATSGQAVLFLGAGYSASAKNRLGKTLPLASELKKSMAELAGCEVDLPLETIAEYFLDTQSPKDYLTFLESHLRCVNESQANREIAKIPWMRVYTTNFDDVYEHSSRVVGIDCKSIQISHGLANATIKTQQVVHINGSIDNLSLETIGQITLTHSSYAASNFLDNPWVEIFRSDLATARAVIFVGYSLVDIDIRRILTNNESLSRKLHFVVREAEASPSLTTLGQYGHVHPIGIDGFAQAIAALPVEPDLPPKSLVFGSFEKAGDFHPKSEVLKDRDVFSLFCYGTIEPTHVWRDQRKVSAEPLMIKRVGFDNASRAIINGSDVVIHGHLSTGKSILLEQLFFNEIDSSWQLYRLKAERYRWREEVRAICESKGRVVVIVDNYPQHREVVDELLLHRGPELSLVLSARTNDFDITLRDIEAKLRDYVDVDINFLTRQEASALAEIFGHYGYLAHLAGTPHESAVNRLSEETRLQLHSILLWLFRSEAVRKSVDEELKQIFQNECAKQFLVNGLILSLLGLEPDMDFVFDFCPDLRGKFNSKARALVSPFSEKVSGAFQAKSAVLSRYVLNDVLAPNELLEIVKKICRISTEKSKFGFSNQQLRHLPVELSKFANQIALFPAAESCECIIEFYEFAKKLDTLKKHVHFWLQYSIARTSMEHFPEAEQLFTTTYEMARKLGSTYNTNFIDNHYARFLILRATRYTYSETLSADVRKAMKLLQDQMNSEEDNKHYPFKVATLLIDFVAVHQESLTEDDLSAIESFGKYALGRVSHLKGHVRENFSVRDFVKKFEALLATES